MDAETLKTVIRKSVVQNQDEQLATVLLEMISAISGLEQQAAAQAQELTAGAGPSAEPVNESNWCPGPQPGASYCQHGSRDDHEVMPAVEKEVILCNHDWVRKPGWTNFLKAPACSKCGVTAESPATSPSHATESPMRDSPSDAVRCQCPPWIIAPGVHVASCPMAYTTPTTQPSSRSGLKGIKSSLAEQGSGCAHSQDRWQIVGRVDDQEIQVECQDCGVLMWFVLTPAPAAALIS